MEFLGFLMISSTERNWAKPASLIIGVLLLLTIPVMTGDPYILRVFILLFVNIIAAVTIRLMMLGGQLNAGQAAFMAIGAYASALLSVKAGLPFWVTFPLAGLTSAGFALGVGFITLRTKGIYFVALTLIFGEVVRLVLMNWTSLTGGFAGIAGISRPDFLGLDWTSRVPYFYLILILMLIVILVMHRIDRSRMGRVLGCLKESEDLSASVGMNATWYRLVAFLISSFFMGLAGSFFAHFFTFISPQFFTIWKSVQFLLMAQIGGFGTLFGPISGAVLITGLPEFLQDAQMYEPVIFGGILILSMLFLPGGLTSIPGLVRAWIPMTTMRLRGGRHA